MYSCNTIAFNKEYIHLCFVNTFKYKELLRTHDLRATDCRIDVLNIFFSKQMALSYRDLEENLNSYDRVTLYRTLNSFIEKGILHRIPDDSGYARYALCQEECTSRKHNHGHIHFKCTECGKIECLETQKVPHVSVAGYLIKEANLILSGTCKTCA